MLKALGRMVVASLVLVVMVGCSQPLKSGAAAPDFTGTTDEGKSFRLSELEGETGVVLYFYPKDETPGCITQACAFRDRLARLNEKGYTVVGISCDSVDSHQSFKAKYSLPFTLVSDPNGDIARKYGVPLERKELAGKPTLLVDRHTFIINKDGTIKDHFEVEDPESQVRQTFEALEVPY